jgi:hypothetical protein
MNYKLFTNLKVMQALLFLLIPVVLWVVEGERLDSISAYAYYLPMTFSLSLTLAGALFFYDGFVDPSRWYNMLSGCALFGVVLFPHLDFPVIHYILAALFFAWSVFNMVFFSSNKQRIYKIFAGVFIIFGILGCYAFNWYSIFWAEWLGMLPISAHYVLEALNKID